MIEGQSETMRSGEGTHRSRRRLCALLQALASCGTLGGEGGGSENLPNRGIIPYTRIEARAIDALPGERLREPSAVLRDGRVALYFEVRTASAARIDRAVGDGLAFGPRETVLEDAGAPSVIWVEGVAHLVFERKSGIGHGTSADGIVFEIDRDPILRGAGIGAPSLVATEEGFELYHQVRTSSAIFVARSGRNLAFADASEVLAPGTMCTGTDGGPEACWDGESVQAPEVRLATTANGRQVLRMMYTGRGRAGSGIGFAAAELGGDFVRFATNPIVDAEDVDEEAPTNLRLEDRYLLWFSETGGIAVAIDDAGLPSERF